MYVRASVHVKDEVAMRLVRADPTHAETPV